MQLNSTLTWLVDAAAASPGADRFLAELGALLIADGLLLTGGALALAVPHPIIARRTWLWRVDNGEVIEAVGAVEFWRTLAHVFLAGALAVRQTQLLIEWSNYEW